MSEARIFYQEDCNLSLLEGNKKWQTQEFFIRTIVTYHY